MTAASPTGSGCARPFDCKSDEAQLEVAIEAAKQRLCAAPDYDEKLLHWREMVRLIDQRSPQRRQFMARVRGLT